MFIILLWAFIGPSLQAPVPSDQVQTTGWVDDPDGRGTFGIITSCVVTLTLCVWSAMHLNIAPTNLTYWQRVTYHVKWIVLGILIPELVILSAWRQYLSAKRMTKEMNLIFEEHDRTSGSSKESEKDQPEIIVKEVRYEWTFVHSLYAGMGGFVFDTSMLPQGEDAFIPKHQRLHLTPLGALLLAKCGLLPNISLQEIKDKSKADGLAKFIVLFQAGWMVVQTLARVAAKLPVTLLEVNTIGHVVCAFIIYMLWWHKPKEVSEPTIVHGTDMAQLCAYFYCSSRMSGPTPNRKLKLEKWTKPELTSYAWFPNANVEELLKVRSSSVNWAHDEAVPNRTLKRFTSGLSSLEQSGMLLEKPNLIQKRMTTSLAKQRLKFQYVPVPNDSERKRHIRQLLASQAIRNYPCLQEPILSSPTTAKEIAKSKEDSDAVVNGAGYKDTILQQLVAEQASDWPSDYYLPGIAGQLMGMVLWLTAMVYGAVHIAAWRDYFPTEAEKIIWRFSSIYISGSSLFWLSLNVFAAQAPWAARWYNRFEDFEGALWEYMFVIPIATICGIAYIFARCFLVIGAVVSLRQLPQAAYDTPSWSNFIPHF